MYDNLRAFSSLTTYPKRVGTSTAQRLPTYDGFPFRHIILGMLTNKQVASIREYSKNTGISCFDITPSHYNKGLIMIITPFQQSELNEAVVLCNDYGW